MNGLMLIAGLILNFYVCYQIYLSNTPSLASQFGIVYLFGLMTLVLIFGIWPKGKRPEDYWYPGRGMGYLSKKQVILFLSWFLIGGLIAIGLVMNN